MARKILRMVAKAAVVVTAAAGLAACGGGPVSSGTIGPKGGTVAAAGVKLSIPAGALSREVQLEVRELPRKEGEPRRIHVGPDDTALAKPATLVMTSDDGNASDERMVEIEHQGELEIEHGLEAERHDEVEHGREAEIEHLGEFELREARTCDVACGAGFECDDGACKAHPEDSAATPDPSTVGSSAASSCPAGMELDASSGLCKAHGGA